MFAQCVREFFPYIMPSRHQEAFAGYTKTETCKKYFGEGMLTEAWMDGQAFGKFLAEWSGRYAVILRETNLIKK